VKNLQNLIDEAGGVTNLLRSSPLGTVTWPHLPTEYTNWRDEHRAWRETCVLFDMSFHMDELHVKGPDCLTLLASLATNKFDPFPVLRAKQLIFLGHDGLMIGDVIAFHEGENHVRLVGAPPAMDWVQFNAETGKKDVQVERVFSCIGRTLDGPPVEYRYQVHGPNAHDLMRAVADGGLPEIKFFRIGEFRIAGHTVRALRHGMSGEAGFEIYGPWNERMDVLAAIEAAGKPLGLRNVGWMGLVAAAQESGWMPMPVPAIYTSEEMRPFREWLTQYSIEALASLGGSLQSDNIEDYYRDPVEMGYGHLIDFNHDFVGKDAVRGIVDNPRRKRITLVWNNDDVFDCIRSALTDPGNGGLYINLPNPTHATYQADAVMLNGKVIGVSQNASYSTNVGGVISPALVDVEHAVPGTEVVLLWGEPNSKRGRIDPHQMREIRARIAPSPYFELANKTKNN
jgi:glycine cleavage system aminomethyltransferase T